MIKFISCFSGIEAASVASKQLGWEAVAFSEIDNFASSVLAHHYPQVPNLGDITKVNWSLYAGSVGLVCGGSPCQAFSVAGLRKSLEDPRGNLTIEFMRAGHNIKPKWVMWENVPGTFSAAGNPFGCFVAGLAGYDSAIKPAGGKWASSGFIVAKDEDSYSLAWRVLDAQYFGVPQRRRRIFLVGHLGKREWWKPLEVLFERPSEGWDSSESGKAREEAAGNSGSSVETIGSHWDNPSNPHPTLNQSHNLGGIVASNQEIFSQRGAGLVMANGQGNAEVREDQAPCLTCNHEAPILFEHHMQDSRIKGPLGVSPQLNAKAGTGGGNLSGSIVRRLTTTECERLQGFPDNWTRIPYRGKLAEKCPDGPRYKALGNSWAVPCARWIFERIDKVNKP